MLTATIEWVLKGLMLVSIALFAATQLAWRYWAHLFKDLPLGDPYAAIAGAMLVFCALVWCYKWQE